MFYSDNVTLIAELEGDDSIDENGIQRLTEVPRGVYGDVGSVTGSEINEAEQRGIKATCRVKVWEEEYHGEKLAEVNGMRLEVYRTFVTGEKIELYMGEKVGGMGGPQRADCSRITAIRPGSNDGSQAGNRKRCGRDVETDQGVSASP